MIWRVKGQCTERNSIDMNAKILLVKVELSVKNNNTSWLQLVTVNNTFAFECRKVDSINCWIEEMKKIILIDWIGIEKLIVVSDSEWQWVI